MSFNPTIDYYAVLGVLPSADDIVVKAVYRALAQRYHPDKMPSDLRRATERLAEINAAYAVLSDPAIRREYDQARKLNGQDSSGYFGDSNEESEPPFDPLDESWRTAIEYYPDLPEIYSKLSNISWRLAYSFKSALIDKKLFEQRAILAQTLEAEFMRCYFGSNPEILAFARELVWKRNKPAARALNQAVAVLGTNVDAKRVIAKVMEKFHLGPVVQDAEVLQFIKTRRAWGYETDAIKRMLMQQMGLSESQCSSFLSRG